MRASGASATTCYTWFPIPMRGNEVVVWLQVVLESHPFPIPMRGNENNQITALSMPSVTVSDPHEGS